MPQSLRQSHSRSKKVSLSIKSGDIDYAYEKAREVLNLCISEHGMKASAGNKGYNQVWARDSMITLLGATLLKDSKLSHALEKSIVVLAENQTPLGQIPNKVDLPTLQPNFRAYADSGLWFVIGTSMYIESTKTRTLLEAAYASLKKTIKQWYEYQNVDNSGLISMQEGSDWEDLFAVRGKGLLVNILYAYALKRMRLVAALVKAGARGKAEKTLQQLAAANQTGTKEPWEFNEWLHGITGRPMGMAEQAWSAGMYIFAYDAVKKGRSVFG